MERAVQLPGGTKAVVREATEDAVRRYNNATASSIYYEDGKPKGLTTPADANLVLLGACLWLEGSPAPVGDAFIKGLPHRVVDPLLKWVKDASGIADPKDTVDQLRKKLEEAVKREDDAKKSQTATTPSSGSPPTPVE